MSDKTPTPQSDEIDLGQLFQLIGNGFKKLFNFIGSIFKGIFHVLMLFLIFIQNHFIKLVIAVVIGAGLGIFLDYRSDQKYVSSMVVEPNFNSVQQLYNNVDFYNELAKAEESVALSKALNISTQQAASIREIEIESYSDENQKIKLFDKFIRELDTSTVKVIDYEAYLKNFNTFDARFHKVNVVSTDNSVAKQLQPALIKSISNNGYFKLQYSMDTLNLGLQQNIYIQQGREIDSLQSLYKKVLVKEADKVMQGTNINLAETTGGKHKELDLLKERDLLKDKMVALNKERANRTNILNIISDFPTRGVKQGGILNKYKFLLPLAMIGLTLLLLLLLELNKFLKKYNKKD